jgi:hypothetical protein
LLAAGCTTGTTQPNEFITEEPSNPNNNGGGSEASDLGLAAAADGGAKSNNAGDDRTVEEADIYRLNGNLLYYLNTYKGLLIYDVGDPANPKLVSRLPVHGVPIEMFFEGTKVYALVRDALDVHMQAGQLAFQRRQRSQLVTVDVTDVTQPKILQKFDIEGQLREGVSRKIGNVIYVVSYVPSGWQNNPQQPETAWVYSYNVAADTQAVDSLQLFQGGAVHVQNDSGYDDKSFSGVIIAATPNSLMVTENWYNSAWSSSPGADWCGNWDYFQSSVVSVVDVSDPAGKIALRTRFEERGAMTDQFKQTILDDKTYLGIFQRNEWSGTACTGTQQVVNRLISVDLSTSPPHELNSLVFGDPGQSVRGSVFDPDRHVVFAITARAIDPLYVLDYTDPSHLAIKSQIDGLSGDMSVFSFAAPGFLLAVGTDTSSTCSGFDMTRASTQMAVSLIDVQKLDAIRLVQRKCVSLDSSNWQWSQISWNQDQAHKILGLYSDSQVSMVGVPVEYWQSTSADGWSWGELKSAVGLMKYDLSAYDPTKTTQNVFEDLGSILHPHGMVDRTLFYRQNGNLMVATLSQTHLAITDLSNLHAPVRKSELEIAPYLRALYQFGAHLVEVLGDPYYGWSTPTRTELRVVVAEDARPVEQRPTLASLSLAGVTQLLQQGNTLLALAAPDSTGSPVLAFIDGSDPTQLHQTGQVSIPTNWYFSLPSSTYCGKESMPFRDDGSYYYGFSDYYYGARTSVSTNGALVTLAAEYGNDYAQPPTWYLQLVDYRDPTQPHLDRVDLPMAGSNFLSVISAPDDPDLFFLNSRDQVGTRTDGTQTLALYKYYTQPWRRQNGQWSGGARINVPGLAEQTFIHDGQRRFITEDYLYTPTQDWWSATERLHLMGQNGGSATQLDVHTFDQLYVNSWIRDGERIYLVGSGTTTNWDSSNSQLLVYDLAGDRFDEQLRADTGGYWSNLLGVNNGFLFLSPDWDGLLVLDMRDPKNPVGIDWVVTDWGITHVAFAQNQALVANGYFGVVPVDLSQSALTN